MTGSEIKSFNRKNVKNKARKKMVSLDKRKSRVGWLFVLPFIIGFVLIYLPIVKDSIWLTFNRTKTLNGGGIEYVFVGLQNYQSAFVGGDGGFVQSLVSGLMELVFDVPAILLFSLFMAVLLNQKMAGRGAFRAIFFLPVILSTGIMTAFVDQNSYFEAGMDDGSGSSTSQEIVSSMDLQMLFSSMKMGQDLVEYVTKVINNIYDIVNRSGVQMLIFLAGLQSISPSIYEACKIDGATGWETFWKITFPMISPMILVNAVYTVIDAFTSESTTVMTYIQNVKSGSVLIDEGLTADAVSTAMSWIYFLIVILIIAAVAGIISMFVFYQRKD